jgi:hypothetical protein
MRSYLLGLSLGFLASGLLGCGSDDKGTADAGSTFKGYGADEGGEFRAEYIKFADGSIGTRVVSYFYADPGPTKYFPFPNIPGCTDMTGLKNWPMATNPVASRTYLDPGTVTMSGGPQTLTVPRQTVEGTDFLNRTHSANNWFFYFNMTDGANYVKAQTLQTVAITGSDKFPAQTFTDVLYTPAAFQLTTPGLDPVAVPAGQDQTFTWGTPDSMAGAMPPAGFTVMSLLAFSGADGPAVLCVEPNDGSITVPAAMVDVARAKYPQGGTLARQTFTHNPIEMKDSTGLTGRRIDFISTWCFATSWTAP